ncbi:MAG: DUF1232 domain-containing protein [Actinomycetota bacterium]|nr:DUF1232 domain-containing protein [Actinomycetota bacterium]
MVCVWWQLVSGAVAGLFVLWLVLIVSLVVVRPETARLTDSLRLLPDVVRLTSRLARDPGLPRSVRWRLWLVLAYLALPIDLVPDVIPVLGYADDLIVVALGLRSVARRAGTVTLARHWPGSADGLAAVLRLVGLAPAVTSAAQ